MAGNWTLEKRAVLDTALEMSCKGLTVGTSGNVSMRLRAADGRDMLAITPNERYYDSLSTEDIVVVDFEGRRNEGELNASIETMLHAEIYKVRSKVNAVIHSHSVFTGTISVLRTNLPSILDDQVCFLGGDITVAEYALPGSQELVKNAILALGTKNAVILANHGAVTIGRDLKEALTNSLILEQTAKAYIHACQAGPIHHIPADAREVEMDFFNSHHGED